jgi:hypothetical protein
MVKTSSGDRSPLLLKSPRRCCRGGEGFFNLPNVDYMFYKHKTQVFPLLGFH